MVAYAAPRVSVAERIASLVERADYHRADTEKVRDEIFRLRYNAYVAEDSIRPTFDKRFTDPYDDTDNVWIFGVLLEGKLVSSIRLHVATKEFPQMPTRDVFPEYLQPELDAGKIIIDPTRHVTDREAIHRYPQLVYLTMRLGWLAAEYFQADMVLAAVRQEHQAFYKRIFGHKVVCEARPYPLLAKPISLMTLDYFAERERVNNRYPYFRSTFFERRMLFERLQEGAETVRAPQPAIRIVPPRSLVAG